MMSTEINVLLKGNSPPVSKLPLGVLGTEETYAALFFFVTVATLFVYDKILLWWKSVRDSGRIPPWRGILSDSCAVDSSQSFGYSSLGDPAFGYTPFSVPAFSYQSFNFPAFAYPAEGSLQAELGTPCWHTPIGCMNGSEFGQYRHKTGVNTIGGNPQVVTLRRPGVGHPEGICESAVDRVPGQY